jgi:hypothetical protein
MGNGGTILRFTTDKPGEVSWFALKSPLTGALQAHGSVSSTVLLTHILFDADPFSSLVHCHSESNNNQVLKTN